jgi:hypothetical protein
MTLLSSPGGAEAMKSDKAAVLEDILWNCSVSRRQICRISGLQVA